MKAKITPYDLEEMRKHTHDPIIRDAFLLKAYQNYCQDLCDEFATDPLLAVIGCVDRIEAKDYLNFYTRQFASIMEYLLKTDRQLKEYIDILEEMGLSDE